MYALKKKKRKACEIIAECLWCFLSNGEITVQILMWPNKIQLE